MFDYQYGYMSQPQVMDRKVGNLEICVYLFVAV
jgi:hypothetical protein